MLEIRMLGELSFRTNGVRVRSDIGANGRLLAAFLFEFPGRVHRRELLTGLFWPEFDSPRARGALNTALWRIRKLLATEPRSSAGINLQATANEVVLEPAGWMSIDTHAFAAEGTTALKTHRHAGTDRSDVSALECAVEGYCGAFLDGVDSDWIIAERERLHSLYVSCLTEIYRTHARAANYEAAIAAIRSILQYDPYRESIQRALAVLLTLNGQRAQAIRTLRQWMLALRQDIDIEPMAETVRLEQSIATGKVFDDPEALIRAYFSSAHSDAA